MRLKFFDENVNVRLLVLLWFMCGDVLPKNPYKSGEVRADNPKGCAYLGCKRGDQCVNRKFWCRSPPCPSMLYCSKSRKESLKGPSSCDKVRCTKGFMCLVKVRNCRWDQPCEQQIARCVTERDYYDGPASCVDFKCPSGLRCILRESLCAKPPCKLVKSCANARDVKMWHEGCRSQGCVSAQECFLRRPTPDCRIHPCKHTPDCSAKNEDELEENEQCRGWICPEGEKCSALNQGPCKRDSCRISRSCHKPLIVPSDPSTQPKRSWRNNPDRNFHSNVDKKNSTPTTNRSASDLSGNNKNSRNSGAEVIRPTVTSLSTWLNHLKMKTGVDAIEGWMEMAEKHENYEAFLEWLESVRDMLGSAAYELWIEEVRNMTASSAAFQQWLPKISTSVSPASKNFPEPVPIAANFSHPVITKSSETLKSIKYRNNENNHNSQQKNDDETWNKNTAININDFPNENYLSPPKNDSTMKFRTTEKSEIPNFWEIPTTSRQTGINDWQQFYNQHSRPVSPAHSFFQNSGNGNGFSENRVSPFQSFVDEQSMNNWYPSLQRSRDDFSKFSNSNNWPNEFLPSQDFSYNQGSLDRRFVESSNPQQQFSTNWSFQQWPNVNGNFYENQRWTNGQSVLPMNFQGHQISGHQRFIDPSTNFEQQFPTDWTFHRQFQDANPYVPNADYWQPKYVPPSNFQNHQISPDQNFPIVEKIPDQQFPTNWTSQLSRSISVPEILLPGDNFDPQFAKQSSNQFNRNHKFVESTKIPNVRRVNENPLEIYSENFAKDDKSWLKYFLDQTSRRYAVPEIFGSSPMNNENVERESWPGLNYDQRNLANVPHRRTKHEDSSSDVPSWINDDKDEDEKFGTSMKNEKSRNFEVRQSFSKLPWLVNPRYRDYLHYLRDRDIRSNRDINEEFNEDHRPDFSISTRVRPIDGNDRSSLPNLFYENNGKDVSRLNYRWMNVYPWNRIYGIIDSEPITSFPSGRSVESRVRQFNGRRDPFPRIEGPRVNVDDGNFGFSSDDRDFRGPIGVSDLWSARFRTPLSSVVHRLHREPSGYRGSIEQQRPITTTNSPPTIASTVSESSRGVENDDVQDGKKKFDNWNEDDGIYPLLLSLQGYIETTKNELPTIAEYRSTNSTILPVYTVEDAIDDDDDTESIDVDNGCVDHETTASGNGQTIEQSSRTNDDDDNLFRNVKYGGLPEFPNNLKNVFDLEAAMIIKNTTGNNDVEIRDAKWEYDYDDEDDDTLVEEDPSTFFIQSQDFSTSIDGTSGGSRNDDPMENYYHDEAVNYEEDNVSRVRSNYEFERLNNDESLDHEQAPEHLVDSFYNDSNRKRFKKSRP